MHQQPQPSIENLQNPLENDSSGEEYPPLNLSQNEEPIMSEHSFEESWVTPASTTASPEKLVSDGNGRGRGGQQGYAPLASRNRPPPSQLPAANIRQGIVSRIIS